MTSAYERESERASERANAVCTDSGGGGGASRGKPHGGSKEMSSFLGGFVRNLYSSCQSTIGDVDQNFEDRIFFSEREHERQRQRAGIRLKKCRRR